MCCQRSERIVHLCFLFLRNTGMSVKEGASWYFCSHYFTCRDLPVHPSTFCMWCVFFFFIVCASTLRVMGTLTGCSVCGHSGRDDFTTQARLIYVGKAPRAPTESVERIRSPSTKRVMANQQLRPPTDRCQDQLQWSVRFDGVVCLL